MEGRKLSFFNFFLTDTKYLSKQIDRKEEAQLLIGNFMNNSLKKQLVRYFAVILAAIILGGSIVVYGIYDIYRLNKEQKFLMESSVTTLKSATGHLEWIDNLNIIDKHRIRVHRKARSYSVPVWRMADSPQGYRSGEKMKR